MSHPLAIFTPLVGAASETFIRRHLEEILPERTVAIAEMSQAPQGEMWNVQLPVFEMARAQKELGHGGLPVQVLRAVGRRLGITQRDSYQLAGEFLQRHGVRVLLGEYLDASLPWLKVCERLGIRFFAHAHGFDVSARLRDQQWRERYLEYQQAAGIVTMSEVSRQRLIGLGLPGDRIHVIPYGVDVPSAFPTRRNSETIRCVAVGRMVSKKAPILTLDAFRRAVDRWPQLRLDYVGGGPLLPAAHQFVRTFELEGQVTLHGVQPHAVVHELLGAADVFLQHSVTDPDTGDEEGLPVGILEALAHGLPVVSTRHAGIPEAVIEAENGYLVDEGDTRTMAECLGRLAQDAGLRERMGQSGWQLAQRRFSRQRETRELARLFGLE